MQYPLLFKYRDPFIGHGFIAGIEIRGRALMTISESGDVWIDGVLPDCISEGGRTEREAASSFREDYRAVVFDIMAEANTFADFKSRIEAVFQGADPITTAEWDRAVELVRKEKLSLDWLEKVPIESFDFGMDIIELKDPKASDNHLPELQPQAPSWQGVATEARAGVLLRTSSRPRERNAARADDCGSAVGRL